MSKWIGAVLALACLLGAGPLAAAEFISPTAMAARMQQSPAPRLLDVRTSEEFSQGHLPGAILIPHDQLAERLAELGPKGEVFVYCRSGRRVKLAAEVLEASGYTVHDIEGSYLAWSAAGLPLEGAPDVAKTDQSESNRTESGRSEAK